MFVRNKHNTHLLRRSLTRPYAISKGLFDRKSELQNQVDQYGVVHYGNCQINEHWEPISFRKWWMLIVVQLTAILYDHFWGGKKNWYIDEFGLIVWFLYRVSLACGIIVPSIYDVVAYELRCQQKYGSWKEKKTTN